MVLASHRLPIAESQASLKLCPSTSPNTRQVGLFARLEPSPTTPKKEEAAMGYADQDRRDGAETQLGSGTGYTPSARSGCIPWPWVRGSPALNADHHCLLRSMNSGTGISSSSASMTVSSSKQTRTSRIRSFSHDQSSWPGS